MENITKNNEQFKSEPHVKCRFKGMNFKQKGAEI